jgi:hypothetical protein
MMTIAFAGSVNANLEKPVDLEKGNMLSGALGSRL